MRNSENIGNIILLTVLARSWKSCNKWINIYVKNAVNENS